MKSLEFKSVFRRAFVLFLASLVIFALCAGLAWWHHVRIAQSGLDTGGPPGSRLRTVFLAAWPELAALLTLYFGLCILAAVWSFARRRRAGRGHPGHRGR